MLIKKRRSMLNQRNRGRRSDRIGDIADNEESDNDNKRSLRSKSKSKRTRISPRYQRLRNCTHGDSESSYQSHSDSDSSGSDKIKVVRHNNKISLYHFRRHQKKDYRDRESYDEEGPRKYKDNFKKDDMYSNIKSSSRRRSSRHSSNKKRTYNEMTDDEEEDEIHEDPMPVKNEDEVENAKHFRCEKRVIVDSRSSSSESSSDTEVEDIRNGHTIRKYNFRNRLPRKNDLPPEVSRSSPIRRERSYSIKARSHYIIKGRHAAHNKRIADSSSSDETNFQKRKARGMAKDRLKCLPMNFTDNNVDGIIRDRQKVGSSLADIDPMAIDREIKFDHVGGMDEHIQSLKEMILFPLMYPEVFEKFKIQPPRGVLFHGPSGTGKTLVARALANECGQENKKVAFFMRKGADCLSKWVGESERQLRLLFDQAYSMRPSIIFFDEIDGIAPVRSTRQDQIHASIVSTLLALMDGLDNRGEVVIIGATNRIDAIDPALRRPGRFDREFYFPLPSFPAREKILQIHTMKWHPAVPAELIRTLAVQTSGYCGADLKALCAEAALIALRHRYPQIYKSKEKLVLNVDDIKVESKAFVTALSKIVPAAQRSVASPARPLLCTIKPLLDASLEKARELIKNIFPPAGYHKSVQNDLMALCELDGLKPFHCQGSHRPRILIHGNKEQGQCTHLGPAILHSFENIYHFKLDFSMLHSSCGRSPEESLINTLREASKRLPAIIYMPHINQWWQNISDSLRSTFLTLIEDMEPNLTVLIIAISDCPVTELSEELQEFFSEDLPSRRIMEMSNPNKAERREFFNPIFKKYLLKSPSIQNVSNIEELPVAPLPEPRKLSQTELEKLRLKEEKTLRELRLFLRDILSKLMRDRRFNIFNKPVDSEEVPDYFEVITEPMDMERIMGKIDMHQYECADHFLKDIELICHNALEYNPDKDSNSKNIRHRACSLRDYTYALIEAEMESEFEETCKEIHKKRVIRGDLPNKFAPSNYHTATRLVTKHNNLDTGESGATIINDDEDTEIESSVSADNVSKDTGISSGNSCLISANSTINSVSEHEINNSFSTKKRRRSFNQRRAKKQKTPINKPPTSNLVINGKKHDDRAEEIQQVMEKIDDMSKDAGSLNIVTEILDTTVSNKSSMKGSPSIKEKIIVDSVKVHRLLDRIIQSTENFTLNQLEELYSTFYRLYLKRKDSWDRNILIKEMNTEFDNLERLYQNFR